MHAGGGTAGAQLVGQGMGAKIERIVIQTIVDAYASQHDAGVIAVLQHHFPDVFHRLILPTFITDMLPTGDLHKDKQARSVTFIDKIVALGVVRGAYRVAGHFFL